MVVKECHSVAEFDAAVKASGPAKAVFVDASAVWCGPCKMISPIFDRLSNQTTWATFLKFDVDKVPALAQRFQITAMPTFTVLKNGVKKGEMKGANPPALTAFIAQHAGTKASVEAASASGSGSDNPESLLPHLFTPHITCLNESPAHPITSIVGANRGPRGNSWLESESDAELLIHLPFNQPVKLKSISIFSGICPAQAPKTIQLFINQPSLDFSNAESLTPTQEIVLTEADVKGERVNLRFVKFQSVNSLYILVKDNQGDEETTRIDSIDILGSNGQEAAEEELVQPASPSVAGERKVEQSLVGYLFSNWDTVLLVCVALVGVYYMKSENLNEGVWKGK